MERLEKVPNHEYDVVLAVSLANTAHLHATMWSEVVLLHKMPLKQAQTQY